MQAATKAPPPGSENVRKVRRLLYTRLGRPTDLRIEGAFPARARRYSGVVCGHAAWGGATGFKRFIAAKRNVLFEGRTADFDQVWRRVCAAGP